jgi:hypothetical protein
VNALEFKEMIGTSLSVKENNVIEEAQPIFQTNKLFLKDTGMKEKAKKTAIITGSSRGIGKETAIILAIKSVNVVVCYRTQSHKI